MSGGRSNLHIQALFIILLIRGNLSKGACLEGAWKGGTWFSLNCTLPPASVASAQCLSSQNILFMGGSTTRMFFHKLLSYLDLQPLHHPCNMQMGWGCFDCKRGCLSEYYHNGTGGRAHDWEDMYAESPYSKLLAFSWKPEIFSVDDIRFLERLARQKGAPVHAIVVHKGVHSVADWIGEYSVNKVPESLFLEDFRVRAKMLAAKLRSLFPHAALIWRDSFFNHLSPDYEEVNVKVRNITTPIFRKHGFYILPGYNTTVHLPIHEPSEDGLHANEAIVDLLLSMMATILCPQAQYGSLLEKRPLVVD